MSNAANKLIQAAAGNAGSDPVYVDDVFSTYLYDGNRSTQGIPNGINLGDFGVGTSTRFNGTSDSLSRSSDLSGNADGKTFTFSCWVFLPPKRDDNQRMLYATDSSDNGFMINIDQGNHVGIEAWDGGSRTLQATTTTLVGTNVWTHILVSIDMANSSNRYVYLNDTAASVTWSSYNNQNIEFTRSTHYVGVWGNGTARWFYDDMAHMYLDYTYRDLSTASNRRIFIDANGGSTSASSLAALNPIMYLPMTTAYAVGKNAGTGGDFTVNGSPTIVENGTEYVADSGKGGMVWIKNRDSSRSHFINDTERGVQKRLQSNSTDAEYDTTSGGGSGLSLFTGNGFALGTDTDANADDSTNDYVSWTFRKQEGFFDIVTYTGNGSFNGDTQTINHNLGTTPGMIIFKRTDAGGTNWIVVHRSGTTNKALQLNSTAGEYTVSPTFDYISNMTSTTFKAHTASDATLSTNASSSSMVAYLFAHDAQDFGEDSDEAIIKCGSYTGAYPSDVTVDLGFEPQFILVKNASQASNWGLFDVVRGMPLGDCNTLVADSSAAENGVLGNAEAFEATATGFIVNSGLTALNVSGDTHIYVAIRRPHKPASEFAATDLFKVAPRSNTNGADNAFVSNFPVDMGMARNVLSSTEMQIGARLTGDNKYLETPTTDAEATVSDWGGWDSMNSVSLGFSKSAESPVEKYGWMFRRAPGFFDVVAYDGNSGSSGTGNTQVIKHNLATAPEFIIVKRRNSTADWVVWTKDIGAANHMLLDTGAVVTTNAQAIFGTSGPTPTATTFTVGDSYYTNATSSTYIAYLFATFAGISKVGTYTGTGSDLNVDCGFSAGARFILIKRSDSSGDWYVWDSVRGIVAGNDPYLLLNSTAAQVTNTDYIDPLASGFTVTSSAPAALNNSGGTYIFYAIA